MPKKQYKRTRKTDGTKMFGTGRGISKFILSLRLELKNMKQIKINRRYAITELNFSITSRNAFGFNIANINIIAKKLIDIKLEVHIFAIFLLLFDSSEGQDESLDSTIPQMMWCEAVPTVIKEEVTLIVINISITMATQR